MNESVAFGPARGIIALGFALALVIAAFGLQSRADGDNAGATMLLVGASGIVLAGGWALAGPVLVLSAEGVRLRQAWGYVSYPWDAVEVFAASVQRRRGLSQHNLEIDVADHLHLLPDWLLGTKDLTEVVGAADALRQSR